MDASRAKLEALGGNLEALGATVETLVAKKEALKLRWGLREPICRLQDPS